MSDPTPVPVGRARPSGAWASALALAMALASAFPGCSTVGPRSIEARPTVPRPVVPASSTQSARVEILPGGAVRSEAGPRPVPPSDPALTLTAATTTTAPTEPAEGPSIPPPAGFYPIDLPTALRLADAKNPVIGEARARVLEAIARHRSARVELVPNVNAGVSYDGHTGPLQRSSGEILRVSRQSLYLGGGVAAEAAGTVGIPAVNIASHLADALYDPLATRQLVDRSSAEAGATTNQTLLEVAAAYLELQGARARLEARHRTESEAAEVARINGQYAEAGEGREADARRAETEWRLRQAQIRDAEEGVAVASAQLCRRLHLDPSVRVDPLGDPLALFELIDPGSSAEDLVLVAVRRRPEIAAGAAGIAAASTRVRQEVARPLLPTVWLGLSGASFGGGSNIVPPEVGNFRGRTDVDVRAFWTLQNFGAGNLARQNQRRAEEGEAVASQARAINQARSEVVAALGEARALRQEIEIARGELATAERGFQNDLELIRQAGERPIEVLNSLNLLREAREALIDAVVGFNQSQFRLFVAMGSPPPLASPTAPGPAVPDAPVAGDVATAEPTEAPTASPPEIAAVGWDGPRPGGRATAEPSGELDRAHRAALEAALEYDRLQTGAQASGGPAGHRIDLNEVALAHRRVIEAEIIFDRALRRFAAEGPTPTPPVSEDDHAAEPDSPTAPDRGP